MPDPDLAAKLALAVSLGAADAELAFLNEPELESLKCELDTWRAAVLRTLQVVIAVFIGTMVIAIIGIFGLHDPGAGHRRSGTDQRAQALDQ